MSREEKTMSIKAYLELESGKTEVRRFGLPESLATVYSALKEKVASVFNLADQEFDITWQDLDGDSIIISSDGELTEAIADSLNNDAPQLLRIYILLKEKFNTPPPQEESNADTNTDEHVGVVCDGCNGKVIGFRFKCVTCPDYDLCSTCQNKGLHSQHSMMRVSKKSGCNNFWYKEFKGPRGGFQTHFGCGRPSGPGGVFGASFNGGFGGANRHPGWGWGPQRGRGFGRRGRWDAWGNGHQNPGGNGSCPFMPFAPEHMTKETEEMVNNAAKEASKQAADIMKGIWTAWSGQNPDLNATANAKPSGGQAAGATASASATSSHSGSSSTAQSNATSPNAEYLKNIGKNVAEMLDPLGIDVEVSVENNGIRQRCSVNNKNTTAHERKKSGESSKMHTEENHFDEAENRGSSPDDMEIVDDVKKSSDKNGNDGNSDTDDWTVVSEDPKANKPRTQSPEAASIYPDLPIIVPHSDPKIQRALDLLCGMGYKDEGGWLTHILEMKNGDINQVLDLIHPPK